MALAYYKPVTLTKADAGDLTDYVELVTLDTTGLIGAGKMQADGDDIRFKDSLGASLWHRILPATINTANTRIYFKVPTVAGSADTVVRMFYGDNTLTNIESGWNVFPFYDSFPTGGSVGIDATRWPTQSGTFTEETDGSLIVAQVTGTASTYKYSIGNVGMTRPCRILANMRMPTAGFSSATYFGWAQDNANLLATALYKSGANYHRARLKKIAGVDTIASDAYAWTNANYYTMFHQLNATDSYHYYDYIANPATKDTVAEATLNGTGYPLMMQYMANDATVSRWDWIAAWPYAPTVTNVIGNEVFAGPAINTVTPNSGYQGQTVPITLAGANFAATPAVILTKGAETITCTGEHYTSSAQIEADVPIGVAETLGWWNMTITNP